MTDYDRIVNILKGHGVVNKELADEILQLFIDIAGERLIKNEGVKAKLLRHILEQGYTKPEFYKEIYQMLMTAEEKTNV